jgi:mannan endo-1,4-beta-mannosidase
MYHACPPTQDEACEWEGGVKSHLDDAEWQDLVTDGGALNRAWKERLDRLVPFLQDLKAAGVAPLFRPLHEMNQGVFWWAGRTGANGTRRLYQLTHDYLVHEHGLDNLVWVWDVQDLSWDFAAYDPGADYYDVAALDVYGDGFTQAKYDAMLAVAGGKPIAIGECARLPTAAELDAQPAWTFFMSWSELTFSDNSEAEIQGLYAAPRVLTLDEMGGWQ